MRTVSLIVTLTLMAAMLAPTQAQAETEVRVYWSIGIVMGGLSIFAVFSSGDLSQKDSEVKSVKTEQNNEAVLLAKAITEHANVSPIEYETPGTINVFRW